MGGWVGSGSACLGCAGYVSGGGECSRWVWGSAQVHRNVLASDACWLSNDATRGHHGSRSILQLQLCTPEPL